MQLLPKKIKKYAAVCAASALIVNSFCLNTFAYSAKYDISEKLYADISYGGTVESTSVLKEIKFNSDEKLKEFGKYSNLSDFNNNENLEILKNFIYVSKPADKNILEFKGDVSECRNIPWDFNISYRLGSKDINPEELNGASGVVEITVDALPNKTVNEYFKNNFEFTVLIPVRSNVINFTEVLDAKTTESADYTVFSFSGKSGEETRFRTRIGTKQFESLGVIIVMNQENERPDFNTFLRDFVKDRAKIKDENISGITENIYISDANEEEDETNNNNAVSMSIISDFDIDTETAKGLRKILFPVTDSVSTVSWIINDVTSNLNDTNDQLILFKRESADLIKRLSVIANIIENEAENQMSAYQNLKSTKEAFDKLRDSLVNGSSSIKTLKAITESADFDNRSTAAVFQKAMDETAYSDEYIPEVVIDALYSAIENLDEIKKEDLKNLKPKVSLYLQVYKTLYENSLNKEVTAEEVKTVSEGIEDYRNTGNPEKAFSTMSDFLEERGLSSGLAISIVDTVDSDTESYEKRASKFINRLGSMIDLREALYSLDSDTEYGDAGIAVRTALEELSSCASGSLECAVNAYTSENFEKVVSQLNTAYESLINIIEKFDTPDGNPKATAEEIREFTFELDRMDAMMNGYYSDILTMTNYMVDIKESSETLSSSISDTLYNLNDMTSEYDYYYENENRIKKVSVVDIRNEEPKSVLIVCSTNSFSKENAFEQNTENEPVSLFDKFFAFLEGLIANISEFFSHGR